MSAAHAALEVRPKSFDGVRARLVARPFLAPVIHRIMTITQLAQRAVSRRFVRAYRAVFGHVRFDDREQSGILRVRDDIGHQIIAELDHAENSCLFVPSAGTADLGAAVLAATDMRLVDFDLPAKAVVAVHGDRELTDLMTDTPCGLVGHAQLSLKLFSRYSVAGRGEQVHRIEPQLQGNPGALEGGTGAGINVMPAEFAAIGWTVSKAIEFSRLVAFDAIPFNSVTQGHDITQTSIVIWKSFEEVLNRNFHGLAGPCMKRGPPRCVDCRVGFWCPLAKHPGYGSHCDDVPPNSRRRVYYRGLPGLSRLQWPRPARCGLR